MANCCIAYYEIRGEKLQLDVGGLCPALKVMTRRFGKLLIIRHLAKVAVITFQRFQQNDVKVMTAFS